jgi:hypothetical protein
MEPLHPWAQNMLTVVATVSAKIAKELDNDTDEGVEVKPKKGHKIIAAFEKSGYVITNYGGHLGCYRIGQHDFGLTVDFREDRSETGCYILFYNNTL